MYFRYRFLLRAIAPVMLALLCAVATANKANAQITLDSASFAPVALPATDTLSVTVYNSPFPVFTMGPDQIWDLTNLVDSSEVRTIHREADSIATYRETMNERFLGYPVRTSRSFYLNRSSLYLRSQQYYDTAFSTSSVTIGTFDSLFIPTQSDSLKPPNAVVHFPSYVMTHFSDSSQQIFHFQLSYELLSYIHAPCYRKRITRENDSVSGYGRFALPRGATTDSVEVLQIAQIRSQTDSFFLNGLPMPGSLLTPLGLVQGMSDTFYTQYYFQRHAITPLVQVDFSDRAFRTPRKLYCHRNSVPGLGLNIADTEAKVSVFPNPNNTNCWRITGLHNEHYCVQFVNNQGIILFVRKFFPEYGHAVLELPMSLPAGPYTLLITNLQNGQQQKHPIMVLP